MNHERAQSRHILFVDDEPNLAAVVREALCDAGYGVVAAETAEEAYDQLRARRFDLLWSDLKLPGMSGLELIRRARELCPGLPVILTTAFADDLTEAEARRLDVTRLLRKPLRVKDIAANVAEVFAASDTEPEPVAPPVDAAPSGRAPASAAGCLVVRGDAVGLFWSAYPAWPWTEAVLLARLTGSGEGAAWLAGVLEGVFRAEAARGADPENLVGALSRQLYDATDESFRLDCLCVTTARDGPRGVRWAAAGTAGLLRGEGHRLGEAAVSPSPSLGAFPSCWPSSGSMPRAGAWVAWLADEPRPGPIGAVELEREAAADLAGAAGAVLKALPQGGRGAALALRLAPEKRPPDEVIDLDGGAGSLPAATRWLEAAVRRNGLDDREGYELVCAAHEALVNAVRHGYGGGPGRVQLRACRGRDEVVLEVVDWGKGAAPGQWRTASDDRFRPSGRGLALMRAFTDRVEVASRPGVGTRVAMARRLQRRGEHAG